MWFLREVLKHISPTGDSDISGLVDGFVSADTTSMIDANLAADASVAKTGTLSKAWTYVSVPMIDRLDMFCMSTAKIHADYSYRSSELKGPREGLWKCVEITAGAWVDEFRETIKHTFFAHVKLQQLGAFDGSARGINNVRGLTNFVLQLLTERATRVMGSILQYPNLSCLGLHFEEAMRAASRHEALHHWQVILHFEGKALQGDEIATMLLGYVVWKDNDLLRMFFCLNEAANADPHDEAVSRLLLKMHNKMHDEKCPEDIHQHVRDRQRCRRHKNISVASVYDAQIHSGTLEGRGLSCPKVSLEALADSAWQSVKANKTSRMSYRAAPKVWPKKFDKLLDGKRSWPSPTVPSFATSLLVFRWLVSWHDSFNRQGLSLCSSWYSRLASKHHMIIRMTDGTCFVNLFSSAWGCLVCFCDRISENHFVMRTSGVIIGETFIFSGVDFQTFSVQGVIDPARSWIVLEKNGEAYNIISHALTQRLSLTKWEFVQANFDYPGNVKALSELQAMSVPTLLDDLLHKTFGHDTKKMEAIRMAYSKEPEVVEEPEMDADMLQLLEDMALEDQVNSGDLKAYRDTLKSAAVRKLSRRRALVLKKARAKKLAAAAKKKAKAKAKGKTKPVAPAEADLTTPDTPVVLAVPDPEPILEQPAIVVTPDATHIGAAPPGTSGDWRALRVKGGWLRFSREKPRLDSHCMFHGRSCKMDRTVRKGPIGYALLWLQAGGHPTTTSKLLHDELKVDLAGADFQSDRKALRDVFFNASITARWHVAGDIRV